MSPPALGLNKITSNIPWGAGTELTEADVVAEAASMQEAAGFSPVNTLISDIEPSAAIDVQQAGNVLNMIGKPGAADEVVLVRTAQGKLVAASELDNALLAASKLLNKTKVKSVIVDAEKLLASKVPKPVKALQEILAKFPGGDVPLSEFGVANVGAEHAAEIQVAEKAALDAMFDSASAGNPVKKTVKLSNLMQGGNKQFDHDELTAFLDDKLKGKALPTPAVVEVDGQLFLIGHPVGAAVASLVGDVEIEVSVYTESMWKPYAAWVPKSIPEAQAALDALSPGGKVNLLTKYPGMASSNAPAVSAMGGASPIDVASKLASAPVEKIKIADIVFTTDTLPVSKIGPQFADAAAGTGPKPVVVKYQGKVYGFANQGKIVAADLLGATEVEVTVVDADALIAAQPAPAPYTPPSYSSSSYGGSGYKRSGQNVPTYTTPKPGEGRKIVTPSGAAKPFPGMKVEDIPIGDLPEGDVQPYPLTRQTAKDAVAGLTSDELAGIREFTNGPYKRIRCAERYTADELRVYDARRASPDHGADFSAAWGEAQIREFKKTSDAISSGLAKAKKVPCVTFRGMGELPNAVIEGLIQSEDMSLGGTSSSAWSADFVHSWSGLQGSTDAGKHRVIYAINHRNGVLVDAPGISSNPGEKEILFPKGLKFKLTGVTRTNNNVLIIYAEEVEEGSTAAPTAPPAKKPRKPRAPKVPKP